MLIKILDIILALLPFLKTFKEKKMEQKAAILAAIRKDRDARKVSSAKRANSIDAASVHKAGSKSPD